MGSVKKYLWISQISLFSLLLICSLIIPSVTERNGGVSNFGDHLSTVVPYVFGFALCILFLCGAAVQLLEAGTQLRVWAYLLFLLAFFEFLVLITTFPRRLGAAFYETHDYLGVVLYAYEFALSVWFMIKRFKFRRVIVFAIQAGGSLVALLSILKLIHLLYYGQIVGAIGFGLLLATVLPEIVENETHDLSKARE